jgi:hypothetical protein
MLVFSVLPAVVWMQSDDVMFTHTAPPPHYCCPGLRLFTADYSFGHWLYHIDFIPPRIPDVSVGGYLCQASFQGLVNGHH